MVPICLRLPEVAEHARITLPTLHRLLRAGAGPTVTRIGGRVVVQEDHYRAWLERNTQSARDGEAA